MSLPVVTGATIMCTMGMAPGTLTATSQTTVTQGGRPLATITGVAPNTNVGPCGMCTPLGNPTVASATAAALGVLTPMPCVPSPVGTWICPPGPRVGGSPVLNNDGTLMCAYGGTISIRMPGQSTMQC